MRVLALRGWPRQIFAKLHRWTGLALIVFLVIAGATGTWLTYRHELDRLINPHQRVVEVGQASLPLEEIYSRVEQRYPGSKATTASLPEHPDDSVAVYLRSTTDGALPFDLVFVNPYTGEILGDRNTQKVTLSTEALDSFMLRLHYSLLAGQSGVTLMGVTALVWLISNFIGMALSWPHAWRRIVAWLPIVSVRARGGAYKVNYDLHRAVGVILLPVLTVLAFSSVALNLPGLLRPTVDAFSPVAPRPTNRKPYPLDAPVSSPEAAVRRSIALVGSGSRVSSIYADYRQGWYSVLVHRPGDLAPYGDHYVYIDLGTGELVTTRLGDTASAGERFLAWQFPLHTGQAFGEVGRAIIAISGIAIVALSVTGFYVWWKKWRERRVAHGRIKARVMGHAVTASGSQVAARGQTVLETGRSL